MASAVAGAAVTIWLIAGAAIVAEVGCGAAATTGAGAAAIGAGAGKLLHRRTASKLEEQAGATMPIGGAGLIVAYPHSAAATV